jgi:hypothetical protein
MSVMTDREKLQELLVRLNAAESEIIVLQADKDVLMSQGESIARERDQLRKTLIIAETERDALLMAFDTTNAVVTKIEDLLSAHRAAEHR